MSEDIQAMSEETIVAEPLPHFTPSSLHALWDADGGLIVSTSSRLPQLEKYTPNTQGQLDYTRPRLFPDNLIYMAFYPRVVLNRGPIFGRLNLSSAELSLAVVRYPRGSGRFGERVHGLRPELMEQWVRLEDVLHEMVSYLLRKFPTSLPEITWPQLPYQYGYRELHEFPEHAIRCSQKAKEAFTMLGALLTFVLSLSIGQYRASPFRRPFEQLLQWPEVTFTEDWLGHLEQSQVCDLAPGLRAGLFIDPYTSQWGSFLENFTRAGVPLWVLWGKAERYKELRSTLKLNSFPMILFPPDPNQIEVLQARAANKPTELYTAGRSSSNPSVPFDYDPPDIIHYKDVAIRPGERRDQMWRDFFVMRRRRWQKALTNGSEQEKEVFRQREEDAPVSGLAMTDCKVFGWEEELGFWRRVRYSRGEAFAQWFKCAPYQRLYWPDVNEWDLCPFLPKDDDSHDLLPGDNEVRVGLIDGLVGDNTNYNVPAAGTTGSSIAQDNIGIEIYDKVASGVEHEFTKPTQTLNSIEEEMTDNNNDMHDFGDENVVDYYDAGDYIDVDNVGQITTDIEPGEISASITPSAGKDHDIFFNYLSKRHGFLVARDHPMNIRIHTRSDLRVTNANDVAKRLNHSACQVPSHFSGAVVDFYNILAYQSVRLSDLPLAFDIANRARNPLDFTRRTIFTKVIRGTSDNRDLYIFEDMSLPAEHWVVALSDPTAVLYLCRSAWDTLQDIVRILLNAGIKFNMPCRINNRHIGVKVNFAVHGLGSRRSQFKPQMSDFALYQKRKKEIFSSSIGRLFRTHGGLLGRLSRDHVSERDVLQGPYRFDTVLADLGGGVVLADDTLSLQHIAIACGVFLVDNTPAGDKYSLKSFWPLPSTWDKSGMNLDGWSPDAEIFYRQRLQKSASSQFEVMGASNWTKKSGIKRYESKMRPILKSARTLAQEYIDKARLSVFR